MNKKSPIYVATVLVATLVVSFFTECAQVGAPTGGPKDTLAPVLVLSTPQNYAVNFQDEKIIIRFNEFFTIKDVRGKFLVSPPLEERPTVKTKGKNLVIELESELADSTTYTFDFSDGIADLNEGNPIPQFQFVVSTGPYTDSLAISGKVYKAEDLSFPEAGVYVMIYSMFNDTIPATTNPDYVCKTNEDGEFLLNNIRPGEYQLFAVQDVNSNMMFDQPSEAIAFLDSLVIPSVHVEKYMDSVKVVRDTLLVDSVFETERMMYYPANLSLYLFTEDYQKQQLDKKTRVSDENLFFSFKRPLTDSFNLVPLNFTPKENDLVFEFSTNNDTLNYWITDTTISKMDTLELQIEFMRPDSLDQMYLFKDTLKMFMSKKDVSSRNRRNKENDKEEVKIPRFNPKTSVQNNGKLDLGKDVIFSFDQPIANFDASKIRFKKIVDDTVEVDQGYSLLNDTASMRNLVLVTEWKESEKYRFYADSAAFQSLLGYTSDSLALAFITNESDDYGTVYVNLLSPDSVPMLVQILNKDESMYRQIIVSESSEIVFNYIKPSKYRVKVIVDDNGNGKWDTGDFLERRQAESCYYYQGTIDVKANWDNKLEMNLQHLQRNKDFIIKEKEQEEADNKKNKKR